MDAEAVRDSLDLPWRALTADEKKRVQGLSTDLFSISEPIADGPKEMNSQAQKNLEEAFEAKQRGEWERALGLLRQWSKYIAPALLSYLRGGIWLESGYPEVAAVFYEYAAKLEPDNASYAVLFLHSLEQSDPARAKDMASQVLSDPERHSPSLIVRAACVSFNATRETSKPDATAVCRPLIQVLTKALEGIPEDEKRSVYMMGVALLAMCHEHLGETGAALDYYSRGLRIDPTHDALLTGRGILTYGRSPQSPSDLEQAVKLRSPLVWPYFFLAHHYLVNNRDEECRRMCERGLAMEASRAVHSQLSEWLAIAEAELGFPPARVRAAFEEALRLDPSNEMARRNLERFEQALPRRTTTMGWEKRSENTVRVFGQAERRVSLAA
jgi:tetratricopeptide (TPR) repeat protein